jgi:hypothetical protein
MQGVSIIVPLHWQVPPSRVLSHGVVFASRHRPVPDRPQSSDA